MLKQDDCLQKHSGHHVTGVRCAVQGRTFQALGFVGICFVLFLPQDLQCVCFRVK